MKTRSFRHIALPIVAVFTTMAAYSQAAFDAAQMSQSDLRGTARYMSMAGAYGALGGDLTSLNQNPAGIGVYRSSDVGITLGLNLQSTSSGNSDNVNNTLFSCNNAAYVGVFDLDSETMPNFNWGFSYNRSASFNRRTAGKFNNLQSSLTNYIAGVTNGLGYNVDNIEQGYSGYAPWLSVLGYYSFAINPYSTGDYFEGLYGNGTTGTGSFETLEKGGIDEYNFTIGGNLYNQFYWGMGFGITDLNYTATTYYKETLSNAYLNDGMGDVNYWDLQNSLHTFGSGWNFKMGFIYTPIQALRLGFAFHTPTYYQLTDQYYADSQFSYSNGLSYDASQDINCATPSDEASYEIRTPWKFIASIATIIGQQATLSFDYQYTGMQTMKILDSGGFEDFSLTDNIRQYFRPTNTYRLGAELRITPQFSVRAGYSYESSPVKNEVINNEVEIVTSGTTPAYNVIRNTQYVTAGAGYKFSNVYTDFAIVRKTRNNDYHAFSPALYQGDNGQWLTEPSPTATVKDSNIQLVLSLGIRF